MRKERLSSGSGGWVLYQSHEPAVTAWLRFTDRAGRLVLTDLFLVDDDGIGTDALRSLPLGRLDAWANGEEGDSIRERLGDPAPDLRRAAGYWSSKGVVGDHWVAQMFAAQRPGSGVPQAPMSRTRPLDPEEPAIPELRLEIPPGRNYGDDFYRQVARFYVSTARRVRAPAMALAEANDVPVTTARRWVKEARARGFLPAGRAGKAG